MVDIRYGQVTRTLTVFGKETITIADLRPTQVDGHVVDRQYRADQLKPRLEQNDYVRFEVKDNKVVTIEKINSSELPNDVPRRTWR